METKNTQNVQQESGERQSMRPKFFKTTTIAALVLFVLIAGAVVWSANYSPRAIRERESKKNLELFEKGMRDFETAMRNDAYGGKTPEETLQLFIDALKKDDIELASKYFMLETNTQDPNYLTRKESVRALRDFVGQEDGFTVLLDLLSKVVPSKSNQTTEDGDYELVKIDENKQVELSILFIFNKYSGIWKIESM